MEALGLFLAEEEGKGLIVVEMDLCEFLSEITALDDEFSDGGGIRASLIEECFELGLEVGNCFLNGLLGDLVVCIELILGGEVRLIQLEEAGDGIVGCFHGRWGVLGEGWNHCT